jgi:hypothetical protein
MAGVPSRPPRPYYVSSTSTSITLMILPIVDNRGSHIIRYELWRDAGDFSSDVNIRDMIYDGFSTTYTVNGLTPGVIYRFAVIALNGIGYSLYSYHTIVASAVLPSAPTILWKDSATSNKTSISVYWNKVADT